MKINKIQLLHNLFLFFAILFSLSVFLTFSIKSFINQILFVLIVTLPLLMIFIFEIFVGFYLFIKRGSQFWKGIFGFFLLNSNHSKKLNDFFKKKDYTNLYLFWLFCLSVYIVSTIMFASLYFVYRSNINLDFMWLVLSTIIGSSFSLIYLSKYKKVVSKF